MSRLKLLVTGANGFVGSALCTEAVARGMAVRGAVRKECELPVGAERQVFDGFDDRFNLRSALCGVTVVIHAAARAHVLREPSADPLSEFRKVNVQGTLDLAKQAAAAGVRRFVFISSIGVNGAETFAQPYSAADEPKQQSAYAVSKYEAELRLQALATQTGMEVVIVRPPLVYGPGAPGNFGSLMRWLKRGAPLPLGAVSRNRRSLVALDNLVDLLITCIDHPAAANQTFLVSDGEDLSTADLLRRLGEAMNKPARLFPVPSSLLQLGANLLGKGDMAQRLLGNLQVDISHTRNTLNWSPPISVDEGLRRAVAGLTP
ncbi:MAG: SDR family oxidoreductase [Hydrogenophaga sp.]|uniref:UDP-glucose 4-epimerase family protein n=1 Tax=Hydrogenophaga sp. TaxID=1904254 RepID=UPI002735B122|nr:SDR family oxidoreductase [Hydrogenophaga sp.]MDP3349055.1 SDR family oxidoreductase [Hydrogenophaga sp.]